MEAAPISIPASFGICLDIAWLVAKPALSLGLGLYVVGHPVADGGQCPLV